MRSLAPAPSRLALPAGTAVALTVAGGVLQAGQARVNGALEERVGVLPTSLASFGVGLVLLVGLVAASAARRRAVAGVLSGRGRWWWRLGGLGGASVVAVQALGVPLIGVALVSVCLVAGQTVGGLVVDRFGLGPGGAHRLTAARIFGAVLAVLAVALGGAGRFSAVRPVLLALLVAAGVLGAAQAAANGQLREVTGDPLVAALVNFVVGFSALGVAALAAMSAGSISTPQWPTSPLLYAGGLGGTAFIAIAAFTVRSLGVLRLTLATVTGQLLGAVVLDLVAPRPGGRLPLATLLAVGLTLLAVAVAGRSA
ncbi:MAG: DMT family transporter [Mycobacteriales bacterium]|jgi:transporter family-2 protein